MRPLAATEDQQHRQAVALYIQPQTRSRLNCVSLQKLSPNRIAGHDRLVGLEIIHGGWHCHRHLVRETGQELDRQPWLHIGQIDDDWHTCQSCRQRNWYAYVATGNK